MTKKDVQIMGIALILFIVGGYFVWQLLFPKKAELPKINLPPKIQIPDYKDYNCGEAGCKG